MKTIWNVVGACLLLTWTVVLRAERHSSPGSVPNRPTASSEMEEVVFPIDEETKTQLSKLIDDVFGAQDPTAVVVSEKDGPSPNPYPLR